MTPFNKQPHARAVVQMTLTGRLIGVYESIAQASRKTNISRTAITNSLKEKSGMHLSGGYLWRYVSEYKG